MDEGLNGIGVITLASDEEPDGPGPHIIVLQALSGEYRVIVKVGEALETIAPHGPLSSPPLIPRDAALADARRLAWARGLGSVYLREDM